MHIDGTIPRIEHSGSDQNLVSKQEDKSLQRIPEKGKSWTPIGVNNSHSLLTNNRKEEAEIYSKKYKKESIQGKVNLSNNYVERKSINSKVIPIARSKSSNQHDKKWK